LALVDNHAASPFSYVLASWLSICRRIIEFLNIFTGYIGHCNPFPSCRYPLGKEVFNTHLSGLFCPYRYI
jgi:hypothetical protein